MMAWLAIHHNICVQVTSEIHHVCCYCVKMVREGWRAEWRSRREPLSDYARLIRGERSAPNCVFLTPPLPGNCALWRRMKRRRAHIFHSSGISEALGTGCIPFFFFQFFPSQSLFPLLSPLSMSCIITANLKTGQMKNNTGKVKGHGVGLCVCYTRVSAGRQIGEVFPCLSEERLSHRRAQTS